MDSAAPDRLRPWVMGVCIAIGIALWLSVGRAIVDWPDQVPVVMTGAIVGLLALVGRVRRMCAEGLAAAEAKLGNHINFAAVIIAMVSAGYFAFTAHRQGRYLHPYWHDELSYVIQMRMLAEGKLWMAAHPVADFFETFYLITDRVYASIYFPGTALLYVSEIWLHLPLITLPLCAAGACVGLIYWILAKVVDPVSALVGALLVISVPIVRLMSVMVMSNVPVLLMGLLLIVAWMKWRENRRLGWALLMGIFAGWAAVCRPLEATCFAAPVGVAILFRLREWDWRKRLATVLLVLVGAAPFLVLQIVMNQHITGDWRVPAWQYYSNRDFPQTTMGFREFDPAIRPVSKLRQKQDIFDMYVSDVVQDHQPGRIVQQWLSWRGPALVRGTMPYSILLIFLPLGIWLCRNSGRIVVAAVLMMFIVLYTISVVFQIYYPIVVIPSVLLLVLLGINAMPRVRPALLLWVALLAISVLPEANLRTKDRLFEARLMRQVDQWEQNHAAGALVLFRYSRNRNIHEEPVYNAVVAWPDDARIIRANDLGPENQKLFEYYAKRHSELEVFLFNEETRTYTRLGTVGELAKSLTNRPSR